MKITEVLEQLSKCWEPPPDLKVSEFADEYRILDLASSASAGKWSTSRAEYQRGMMDAICEPGIHTVVFKTSAQVGKTEILNNVLLYYAALDCAPVMYLHPTERMAESISKDRIGPMFNKCSLTADMLNDKTRDGTNTILHKKFANSGHLTLAGANSPASLASRPIRILLADEVDRYPLEVGDEGDVIDIARKRLTAFYNRRFLAASTPTVKGVSRIDRLYEDTDQRRFFVPCPFCNGTQALEWQSIKWEQGQPETAYLECQHCRADIPHSLKAQMIRQGQWQATNEEAIAGHAGFHVNELYSPFRSWSEVVTDFLAAKRGNVESLKTWINTSLGESFDSYQDAEGVVPHVLETRCEEYPAEVPQGGMVLVGGVDIQADRAELSVFAYGGENFGEESWLIEHRVINGDPAGVELWQDLGEALRAEYQHESGRQLQIACTCIDSGHLPDRVYEFVKRTPRTFPIKGSSTKNAPIWTLPRRRVRGVSLAMIGSDSAKDLLYARLRLAEPGPGFIHFPNSVRGTDYFSQLCAEKKVTKYVKGYPRQEYVKLNKRNETLDCACYALAAVKSLNVRWQGLAKHFETEVVESAELPEIKEAEQKPVPEPKVAPSHSNLSRRQRPHMRRPGSGFLRNF